MEPRAVFLDRDGTVSVEMGYIHAADLPRYALIPGAAAGMKKLAAAGFKLCLTTNQSGVARGYYGVEQVEAVHARLRELLAREGAALDAVYYCPHHPDPALPADSGDVPEGMAQAAPDMSLAVDCDCRKPRAGMALRARDEFGLDLERCWVVGDKAADMGFAESLGGRAVLVKTGYGARTLETLAAQGRAPRYVAKDLEEAADMILRAGAYE